MKSITKYGAGLKESDIQRLILDWLAARKIWNIRQNTGSFTFEHKGKSRFFRAGKKGMADILAAHGSINNFTRMFWIEVKTCKGIQSPDQKEFQQEVEAQGMKYILARSLEDVIQALK